MRRQELEDRIVALFKEAQENNYREYLVRYDLTRLLDMYDADTEEYWIDWLRGVKGIKMTDIEDASVGFYNAIN